MLWSRSFVAGSVDVTVIGVDGLYIFKFGFSILKASKPQSSVLTRQLNLIVITNYKPVSIYYPSGFLC